MNAHDRNSPGGEPIAVDDSVASAKVHVTFFSDFAATRCTTENRTLMELRERVLNAAAREKGKLPWLKLAIFGKKRTDRDSLRHDANVTQITGIELDYDIEQVSFDDAVKAVEAMGIHALLYTSASHTLDKPRWRVLAPTSESCAPELRYKLAARLNGALKSALKVETIAKSESFALSQSFFYGWVCDSPMRQLECFRALMLHGTMTRAAELLVALPFVAADDGTAAGEATEAHRERDRPGCLHRRQSVPRQTEKVSQMSDAFDQWVEWRYKPPGDRRSIPAASSR